MSRAGGPGRGRRALAGHRRLGRLLRWLLAAAALSVAGLVVSSRGGELSGTSHYLGRIDLAWVLLAVVVEILSMACYAGAQRRLLREAGNRRPLRRLLLIAFAGNAVNNSLPAGPAFGAVYSFRQLRNIDVGEVVAAWVIVATTVMLSAALAVMAALGVTAAVGQGTAFDLLGVTLGTLAATAGLIALLRQPRLIGAAIRVVLASLRAVLRRSRWAPVDVAGRIQARLESVEPSWPGMSAVFGWALGNWCLDLACLITAFQAMDVPVPWRGLLLAYGAAQLAANLPVTPGGLGVVEGSLTIGLVAYGGSAPSSVAAVLIYRLISFWALLLVGWACVGALAVIARRRAAVALPPPSYGDAPAEVAP
ncbi:MAG TPA: YbhN family protein [Acidimicrobiales bacterium]|nr:YbhN family protein [Acidimicrobiales bacterium]